jgi:hypothetical protein
MSLRLATPPDPINDLRRELAALEREFRFVRQCIRDRKYSPDQPRIPAGNPDGGQWAGGSDTEADVSVESSRPPSTRLASRRISPAR